MEEAWYKQGIKESLEKLKKKRIPTNMRSMF